MTQFKSAATYQIIIPDGAGTTLTITGGDNQHRWLDGAGSPGVIRHFRPWPQADGGIDQGLKLQERQLVWKLFVSDSSETNLEDARYTLSEYIKPNEEPIVLKVTRADGAIRYLDCFLAGPVEWAQSEQVGLSVPVTLPLYAPDPCWYHPGPHTPWAPYDNYSGSTPASYGATSASQTLTYSGNWEEHPIIAIAGEFVDLELDLSPTGIPGTHTLDLTGYSTPGADTVRIDLRKRTATLASTGADMSAEIVNADWTDIKLYPTPLASGGGHTLAATYVSRGVGSSITVSYRNRYIHL